jgi:hypothetical protein
MRPKGWHRSKFSKKKTSLSLMNHSVSNTTKKRQSLARLKLIISGWISPLF